MLCSQYSVNISIKYRDVWVFRLNRAVASFTSLALTANFIETILAPHALTSHSALPCDFSVFLPGDNDAAALYHCSLRALGQQVPGSVQFPPPRPQLHDNALNFIDKNPWHHLILQVLEISCSTLQFCCNYSQISSIIHLMIYWRLSQYYLM